jgi:membrane-bound ClpP family serine protease
MRAVLREWAIVIAIALPLVALSVLLGEWSWVLFGALGVGGYVLLIWGGVHIWGDDPYDLDDRS